jgi:hypothetical protein
MSLVLNVNRTLCFNGKLYLNSDFYLFIFQREIFYEWLIINGELYMGNRVKISKSTGNYTFPQL